MGITITTLNENTSGHLDLLSEWGLSLHIQDGGKIILLDTGQSNSLIHNAEKLDLDIRKIDVIVLSHAHLDHTGGLRSLLAKMKKQVDIVAHPDVWQAKYVSIKGKPDRFVGIPYARKELESLGARFILTTEPFQVSENILTTGEIPMVTDFEKIESIFSVRTSEGYQPDQLKDDLALITRTGAGLSIILGCAHHGMINTLFQARKVTGINKVNLVLGGCHLKDATDEQIWQSISALNEIGVQKLALSHCTGLRATILMSQIFGNNFIVNNTGSVIKIN